MELISKYINILRIKLSQPEYRERATVTLLVVFLAILTALFLRPAYMKIKSTREKNLSLRNEVSQLKEVLDTYKEASKNYEAVIGYKKEFDSIVPLNPEPSSLLNKLNYFSLKSRVFLGQTILKDQDNGVEKRETRLQGGFTEIEEFFKIMYSDARLFQVEALKLSKKEERSNSNFDLDLLIVVNAYYEEE